MKHFAISFILYFFGIMTICFLSYGAVKTIKSNVPVQVYFQGFSQYMIPDANGLIVYDDDGTEYGQQSPWGLDSLTLFLGFPYTSSGVSADGGIFCNMDDDDDLEIVYNTGMVNALNLDGTPVPGWPQDVPYMIQCSPAYGDIDGDDVPEIVVSSRNLTSHGYLAAFELY